MILSFQLMKFLCCLSYAGNIFFLKLQKDLKLSRWYQQLNLPKLKSIWIKECHSIWKIQNSNYLIASVFQWNPSKYLSKSCTVCSETKPEPNQWWTYFTGLAVNQKPTPQTWSSIYCPCFHPFICSIFLQSFKRQPSSKDHKTIWNHFKDVYLARWLRCLPPSEACGQFLVHALDFSVPSMQTLVSCDEDANPWVPGHSLGGPGLCCQLLAPILAQCWALWYLWKESRGAFSLPLKNCHINPLF